MSKDIYDLDNLDSMLDDIENDIRDTIENELKEKSEETMHEYDLLIKDMYDGGYVDRYQRDPNDRDAFENRDNVVSNVVKNGNTFILNTYNIAKGEGFDKGFYLDEIIETGVGYQFGNAGARPVVEMSQNYIDEISEDVVNNGLKKRGWNLE